MQEDSTLLNRLGQVFSCVRTSWMTECEVGDRCDYKGPRMGGFHATSHVCVYPKISDSE